jgi:hypothetical protein
MNADLAAQHAFDRMAREGFEALDERAKNIAAAWLVSGKVANDGFGRYFAGATGDLAYYAPAAFRGIGAFALAEIVEDANRLLGAEFLRRERAARAERVRALEDAGRGPFDALEARFYACPDDVDLLLDAYVNPAHANRAA